MRKVAVVGANGQVGAEICLLLGRDPDIELIPICRNRSGSAFLRHQGLACRHGLAADPAQAPSLIGDCDVIVNCALTSGTPNEIRAFDRTLLRNLFACSRDEAIVIHLSTLMVYGDPRPGVWPRLLSPYGRAKLAAERRVQLESRRSGKRGYILRLGHVCGPLQNITQKIRDEIVAGRVLLPIEDTPSNTVYTLTIVDALLSIMSGRERPGVYDLTNSPQWTWLEVYECEARALRVALKPTRVVSAAPLGWGARVLQWMRGSAARLARTTVIRHALEKFLALGPAALNDRAQATWFKVRARAEIGELSRATPPAPELTWMSLAHRPMNSLRPSRELIEADGYASLSTHRSPWPEDLPRAKSPMPHSHPGAPITFS
jgi:nucleoside-diphosphate-sugar epimerase